MPEPVCRNLQIFQELKMEESQDPDLFSKENCVVGDGFQETHFELRISHFIVRKLSYCQQQNI